MTSRHIEVKNLPSVLQSAVKNLTGQKDIRIVVGTTFSTFCGFEGNRAIATAVNLFTGETQTMTGSWGGRNPFESRPLDRAESVEIPVGFAVVSGETGGRGTFLTLHIRPENFDSLALPQSSSDLTPEEQKMLNLIKVHNARGRVEELQRRYNNRCDHRLHLGLYSPENPLIQSLTQKGLLKINKAGAISLTTEGKNQAKRYQSWDND